MHIPNFQSLMLPILLLASNGSVSTIETVGAVCAEFNLTDEDRREMLPSGRQTRLANRVNWAFTHLAKAGLLQRAARGIYGITEAGREVLRNGPNRIDINFLASCSESFRQFRSPNRSRGDEGTADTSHQLQVGEEGTPEERLEAALRAHNESLEGDIQERVHALNDVQFEQLIIKGMLGLGYGAGGAGTRTGGSGDGGIDGVITEDVLGLDKIYLQAKNTHQIAS